ncbi:hypothetical protein HYX06_05055 [Candidatus Woesearchaeota archaeon]|nr:hypothetical protein [Candidatus Woesearchaeota archaeon]
MATHKLLSENKSVVITTPDGDLVVKVTAIFGDRHNRSALAEIHGSPLVRDGSLVDLAQTGFTALSKDVRIKISNDPGSRKNLALYIEKPSSYKTSIIDESEYPAASAKTNQ